MVIKKDVSEVLSSFPNSLVVTSDRYEPIIKPLLTNQAIILVSQNELAESHKIAEMIKSGQFHEVIAIGSGKAIDSAKYACFLTNTYLSVVPACLSTNCFFTDKSTLFDGVKKHTTDSRIPDEIVFDWNLIRRHMLMNNCGLLELLSSSTALVDWQIARDKGIETINQKIYDGGIDLVRGALEMLDGEKYDMDKHVSLLEKSGDLVIEYKTGRPVSGSDHIISSYIESHYRCPHGIALFIAIPIGLTLQGYMGYPTQFQDIITRIYSLQEFKNYIISSMDKQTLIEQLSKITPRPDRYSVVDLVTKEQIKDASEEVLNAIFS